MPRAWLWLLCDAVLGASKDAFVTEIGIVFFQVLKKEMIASVG